MITLSDSEREKFALFLRQEAQVDQEMSEQMKKINTPLEMIKRTEIRSKCFTLVADYIDSWEQESIR